MQTKRTEPYLYLLAPLLDKKTHTSWRLRGREPNQHAARYSLQPSKHYSALIMASDEETMLDESFLIRLLIRFVKQSDRAAVDVVDAIKKADVCPAAATDVEPGIMKVYRIN